MPKQLDEWPAAPEPPDRDFLAMGIADGRIWELAQGEDYSVKTHTQQQRLRSWAQRHGYECTTQVIRRHDSKNRLVDAGVAVRLVKKDEQEQSAAAAGVEERGVGEPLRPAVAA